MSAQMRVWRRESARRRHSAKLSFNALQSEGKQRRVVVVLGFTVLIAPSQSRMTSPQAADYRIALWGRVTHNTDTVHIGYGFIVLRGDRKIAGPFGRHADALSGHRFGAITSGQNPRSVAQHDQPAPIRSTQAVAIRAAMRLLYIRRVIRSPSGKGRHWVVADAMSP
jgi:hypothetical protein